MLCYQLKLSVLYTRVCNSFIDGMLVAHFQPCSWSVLITCLHPLCPMRLCVLCACVFVSAEHSDEEENENKDKEKDNSHVSDDSREQGSRSKPGQQPQQPSATISFALCEYWGQTEQRPSTCAGLNRQRLRCEWLCLWGVRFSDHVDAFAVVPLTVFRLFHLLFVHFSPFPPSFPPSLPYSRFSRPAPAAVLDNETDKFSAYLKGDQYGRDPLLVARRRHSMAKLQGKPDAHCKSN